MITNASGASGGSLGTVGRRTADFALVFRSVGCRDRARAIIGEYGPRRGRAFRWAALFLDSADALRWFVALRPWRAVLSQRPPAPRCGWVGPGGSTPLGPTTYAAPRSATAIDSVTTIRGVGTAGSSPLAPTTLRDPDQPSGAQGIPVY